MFVFPQHSSQVRAQQLDVCDVCSGTLMVLLAHVRHVPIALPRGARGTALIRCTTYIVEEALDERRRPTAIAKVW